MSKQLNRITGHPLYQLKSSLHFFQCSQLLFPPLTPADSPREKVSPLVVKFVQDWQKNSVNIHGSKVHGWPLYHSTFDVGRSMFDVRCSFFLHSFRLVRVSLFLPFIRQRNIHHHTKTKPHFTEYFFNFIKGLPSKVFGLQHFSFSILH